MFNELQHVSYITTILLLFCTMTKLITKKKNNDTNSAENTCNTQAV